MSSYGRGCVCAYVYMCVWLCVCVCLFLSGRVSAAIDPLFVSQVRACMDGCVCLMCMSLWLYVYSTSVTLKPSNPNTLNPITPTLYPPEQDRSEIPHKRARSLGYITARGVRFRQIPGKS